MKKILGIGNALVDILVQLPNDEPLHKLELPKGSMQLIDQTTMKRISDATSLLEKYVASDIRFIVVWSMSCMLPLGSSNL